MNKIIEIAEKNNGYIFGEIIKQYNIPTIYLTRFANKQIINKVARGVYLLNGYIEDPFYINSIVYSNIIYSRNTALYLNGLSNMQLDVYEATVAYNNSLPKIPNFIIHQTRSKNFTLGLDYVETPYGNKVKCYDKERCICDLFIYDTFDYEDKVYAINEYKNKYLNLKKLYEYAKILEIYKKVKNVFELFG